MPEVLGRPGGTGIATFLLNHNPRCSFLPRTSPASSGCGREGTSPSAGRAAGERAQLLHRAPRAGRTQLRHPPRLVSRSKGVYVPASRGLGMPSIPGDAPGDAPAAGDGRGRAVALRHRESAAPSSPSLSSSASSASASASSSSSSSSSSASSSLVEARGWSNHSQPSPGPAAGDSSLARVLGTFKQTAALGCLCQVWF